MSVGSIKAALKRNRHQPISLTPRGAKTGEDGKEVRLLQWGPLSFITRKVRNHLVGQQVCLLLWRNTSHCANRGTEAQRQEGTAPGCRASHCKAQARPWATGFWMHLAPK